MPPMADQPNRGGSNKAKFITVSGLASAVSCSGIAPDSDVSMVNSALFLGRGVAYRLRDFRFVPFGPLTFSQNPLLENKCAEECIARFVKRVPPWRSFVSRRHPMLTLEGIIAVQLCKTTNAKGLHKRRSSS